MTQHCMLVSTARDNRQKANKFAHIIGSFHEVTFLCLMSLICVLLYISASKQFREGHACNAVAFVVVSGAMHGVVGL
jgi:hypothetical protein